MRGVIAWAGVLVGAGAVALLALRVRDQRPPAERKPWTEGAVFGGVVTGAILWLLYVLQRPT